VRAGPQITKARTSCRVIHRPLLQLCTGCHISRTDQAGPADQGKHPGRARRSPAGRRASVKWSEAPARLTKRDRGLAGAATGGASRLTSEALGRAATRRCRSRDGGEGHGGEQDRVPGWNRHGPAAVISADCPFADALPPIGQRRTYPLPAPRLPHFGLRRAFATTKWFLTRSAASSAGSTVRHVNFSSRY
jgi:hypothetical protein